MSDDPYEYARQRWRRLATQRTILWARAITGQRPDRLHRLHNVVYPDPRHFFCPASWTDEGWARHGGKQEMIPETITKAIREALTDAI